MIAMLVELLKNIKQAALTHAVSATMVVQGLAMQQATINDFSQQEKAIVESLTESQSAPQPKHFDNDKYWQDFESLVEASEIDSVSQELVAEVGELYEEQSLPLNKGEASSPPSSSVPLVAANFGVTAVAPVRAPSNSDSSSKKSNSKAPAASGGQNNISADAVQRAVASVNSSESSESEVTTEPSSTSESVGSGGESSSSEANVSSSASGSASEDEGSQEQEQEEQQEEEQEEETFEYLGNVYLIKDGTEQVQLVSDEDELVLDPEAEYSLLVESSEDFGSVNFNLENRDNNDIHQAQENQLPFALNGDSGPNKDLKAFDFEQANYQLDLRAYDSNGQGGEVLETRTIRFSVSFSQED